jgi:hypothetical protein
MIMNEMNELETLLRSWAPRRPSPRVKEQIFATGQADAAAGMTAAAREPLRTPQGFGLRQSAGALRSEHLGQWKVKRQRTGTVQDVGAFAAAVQSALVVARALRGQAGRLPYFAVRLLAPAMAAMMLMAALVSQRNDTALSSPARSGPLVAMMMSNQSAAAYLPASFQPEQNRVTPQTFEWTNGSSSTSSIRSLSVLRER